MFDDELLVETRGAVRILTLHRPDRLNAVSATLYGALEAALDGAEEDGEVRAVVVTGAGRAFCVGADLVAHGEGGADEAARRDYVGRAQRVTRRLRRSPLPVVAAVNGHAIGAGLELALAADLSVVASGAKLRLPELALGTFVGGGVIHTLPRRVGETRTRELLLRAPFFSGEEAAGWGLCNRAVPAEEVLGVALQWAEEAARLAPRPVRLAKDLLDRAAGLDMDGLMDGEAAALLECMGTEDWHEGIRAFHEKREPRYTGR